MACYFKQFYSAGLEAVLSHCKAGDPAPSDVVRIGTHRGVLDLELVPFPIAVYVCKLLDPAFTGLC